MPQFNGMYSGPERRAFDAYPTEETLIAEFLTYRWGHRIAAAVAEKYHTRGQTIKILDPCAGQDARWGVRMKHWLRATYSIESHLTAIDIQDFDAPPFVDSWHNAGFLDFTFTEKYDIIISNPPYGPVIEYSLDGETVVKIPLAEAFIYKGFDLLENGGIMSYLLNLDIQAGQKRYDQLWQTTTPTTCVVCSRRPSFYGGKTSGNNYAIFLWEKDESGDNIARPREWQTYLMKHERGIT